MTQQSNDTEQESELERSCIVCGTSLDITVHDDGTYEGGHYWDLDTVDGEYWECDDCAA